MWQARPLGHHLTVPQVASLCGKHVQQLFLPNHIFESLLFPPIQARDGWLKFWPIYSAGCISFGQSSSDVRLLQPACRIKRCWSAAVPMKRHGRPRDSKSRASAYASCTTRVSRTVYSRSCRLRVYLRWLAVVFPLRNMLAHGSLRAPVDVKQLALLVRNASYSPKV